MLIVTRKSDNIKANKESICLNKNYSDISIDRRTKILKENSDVKNFLDHLPAEEQRSLKKMFLTGKIKNPEKNIINNWMLGNSEFYCLVKDRPSDERVFRFLYREREPIGIDKYYTKSFAGQQINQRLESMKENLPLIIRDLQNKFPKKKIEVINFFSGLALEWVSILNDNPDIAEKIIVKNIDNDPMVCEKGLKIAKKNKLDSSIQFECKDFKNLKPSSAHLAVLVGVLCPLPEKIQTKLLQAMHLYVCQGGYLITSVPTPAMVEGDPFTDMMMRLVGWSMNYKTREMIKNFAAMNGWQEKQIFYDNKHYHCMSVFIPQRTWQEKLKIKVIFAIKQL